MPDTPDYLSLKLAQATKTGPRSTGRITYRILTDVARQSLYLTLVANDSSGWFSPEIVPLALIEELLSQVEPGQTLRVRQIGAAFKSRSVNNGGFAVAALRAEGLIGLTAHANHQYVVTDDWELWKSVMLSEPGEPYVPPPPKGLPFTRKEEIAAVPDKPNEPDEQEKPVPSSKRKARKPVAVKALPEKDEGLGPDEATDSSTDDSAQQEQKEQQQDNNAEPEPCDEDTA